MADVYIYKRCDDLVAHLTGVRAELKATAYAGAKKARQELAAHRDSGDAKITATKGNQLDWFVNLDDQAGERAAYAIEFGHTTKSGKAVQGIHALAKAF